MNIAYYSHYFSPEIGAPSARVHEMSKRWIEMGHEIDVVTCFPNHPDGVLYPGYDLKKYAHEVMDGIHVHRNWTYITPNEGILKKTVGHLSFWPSSRIFSSRKMREPDIVIGTSPTFFAPMAARGTAKSKDVPFIMEVRDLWPGIFIELGVITNRMIINILEAWELWMYRESDLVITVTNSFRENIISRGIDSEKVYCIPNGADTDLWEPLTNETHLASELNIEGKFVVLYIGAHGISQALDKVLESAKILLDREEIIFLFVGSGSQKEKLVEKANREGIRNVEFHDPIPKEEVKRFYNLADVCLVPLRDVDLFEAFIPSKIFEIMAMETPILASLRGEAKTILEESNAAVVVPPEGSEQIADAVLALYNDSEKRSKMAKNGRKFVLENYSREKLAGKYISIMQNAL